MKRNDFKKVVKCFSYWKIDKRKGNYKLPSGQRLKDYLLYLCAEILEKHNKAIGSDGNIYDVVNNKVFIPFKGDEELHDQWQRIKDLINEML